MGVVTTVLTAGLVLSAVLLPFALMAARAPRGRRVARRSTVPAGRLVAGVLCSMLVGSIAGLLALSAGFEARGGGAVAFVVFALGMALVTRKPREERPSPKRRAQPPSLASRIAVPTTAAAGTGAAIVLVTAGTAGTPAPPRADEPVTVMITSAQTIAPKTKQAAHPGKVAANRVAPTPAQDAPATQQAVPSTTTIKNDAAKTPAPTKTPVPAALPTATPTARPDTPPAEEPTTPAAPEEQPDLLTGVVGLVGGLVGGLLGP